jgi:DNA-binding MarR family transcriptional regulator
MNERAKFNLTGKQREIYDAIVAAQEETGVTPTQKELAAKFGIAQATVAKHLAAIERRGWIQRAAGLKNGLTIL